MAKILIIDDDQMMNEVLSSVIQEMGHDTVCAFTLQEGVKKASADSFDVVFLDVRMPDGNGLEAIPRFKAMASVPEVIIITGYGDPDGAELAIKNGAWDYVKKPSSMVGMTLPLTRALEYREEKRRKSPLVLKRDSIIGNSPQIKASLEVLAQAAVSDANVLIVGETGTGKELFARALHENSSRAEKPFVVVDCAALPGTLIESTLFGHKKGAFTSADRDKEGLVGQAHGGTLFLDEVGELPLSIQKAFLRVIQEHRFLPVGATQDRFSDFRLVAATNRDLDQMVIEKKFRQDLIFRIRSFAIELSPLRGRTEDIKSLAFHYTNKLCDVYGTGTKGFSPEFFDALTAYEWPGNVRELINTLERVHAVARHEHTFYPTHLPTYIRVKLVRETVLDDSAGDTGIIPSPGETVSPIPGHLPDFKAYRESTERRYLKNLMREAAGNKQKATRLSGLSRTRLFELLKKHSLSDPF